MICLTMTAVCVFMNNSLSLLFSERAKRAKLTLSHVQLRFQKYILLAIERDTYRGNTIENRGCLFIYLYICMDVCMSFCTLTLAFLC